MESRHEPSGDIDNYSPVSQYINIAVYGLFTIALLVWFAARLVRHVMQQDLGGIDLGLLVLVTGLIVPAADHLHRSIRSVRRSKDLPARRNWLKGLLALLLVFGGFSWMALSSQEDYSKREMVVMSLNIVQPLKIGVAVFHDEYHKYPGTLAELGYRSDEFQSEEIKSVQLKENGSIVIAFREDQNIGTAIILSPRLTNGDISWDCTGGDLKPRFRPGWCRR